MSHRTAIPNYRLENLIEHISKACAVMRSAQHVLDASGATIPEDRYEMGLITQTAILAGLVQNLRHSMKHYPCNCNHETGMDQGE